MIFLRCSKVPPAFKRDKPSAISQKKGGPELYNQRFFFERTNLHVYYSAPSSNKSFESSPVGFLSWKMPHDHHSSYEWKGSWKLRESQGVSL